MTTAETATAIVDVHRLAVDVHRLAVELRPIVPVILFNPTVEFVRKVANTFPRHMVFPFFTLPVEELPDFSLFDEEMVVKPMYLGHLSNPAKVAAESVRQMVAAAFVKQMTEVVK